MSGADFLITDLPEFFGRFLLLSLLSIGGAMSTAPEMHRYLVGERGWLDDGQFTTAVALAQASPGPNVIFVPVLGFQVAGWMGALAATIGILAPSTLLSLAVSRWGSKRRDTPGVRAFTSGLAPMTVSLLACAGWVLALPYLREPDHRLGGLSLIALTILLMHYTRLAPIGLILAGGLVGAMGWI